MRSSILTLALLAITLGGCSSPDTSVTAVDAELSTARHGRRCYSLQLIGRLGGHEATPYAMNDRGAVTGESQKDGDFQPHAFLWRHDRLREISPPGATFSIGLDINNRGDVVGVTHGGAISGAFLRHDGVYIDLHAGAGRVVNDREQIAGYLSTAGQTHAFFWERGHTIDLGTLGGVFSDTTGLDERGEVVGYSDDAAGRFHGFLWRHGRMFALGSPNGEDSFANAVNDRGEVVGSFGVVTPSGFSRHAVLWRDGRPIDLGTLGGEYSFATAINIRTQVVGESTTASGELHAFLWEHGAMSDLGPGSAEQINDRGEVVGNVELGAPFVWHDGIRTALPTLGAGSHAVAMNQRGQIAGDVQDPAGGLSAALWEPDWCE